MTGRTRNLNIVETFTPENVMTPIGPYSHVAKAGGFIMLSAIAGVDPSTNELAGPDIESQTRQIIRSFKIMLEAAGSDLNHVMHVTVFLTNMDDFKAMNAAYEQEMAPARPARTAVAVAALPKPGARVTMNLTAIAR